MNADTNVVVGAIKVNSNVTISLIIDNGNTIRVSVEYKEETSNEVSNKRKDMPNNIPLDSNTLRTLFAAFSKVVYDAVGTSGNKCVSYFDMGHIQRDVLEAVYAECTAIMQPDFALGENEIILSTLLIYDGNVICLTVDDRYFRVHFSYKNNGSKTSVPRKIVDTINITDNISYVLKESFDKLVNGWIVERDNNKLSYNDIRDLAYSVLNIVVTEYMTMMYSSDNSTEIPKVSLSDIKTIEDIKTLIGYILDSEEKHFEESDGDKNHIYAIAQRIKNIMFK
jgi:hypothetical protein